MMVLSASAPPFGLGKMGPRTEGVSFMSATIHRSVSGATLAECEAQLEPGETIEHVFGYPFGDVVCLVNTVSPETSAVAEKVSHRVRRLDRGYVREVPGEITSGGYQLVIHLAGADDTSPAHRTYPSGYDSRCGWCYLGANHSSDAHAAGVQS